MKGEEIYKNLLRIDELEKIEEEGERKLTKEEQMEYMGLTKKKLYTLSELKSYHNITSLSSEKLENALEIIVKNLEKNEGWEINEDLPEGLIERLNSLEKIVNEKTDIETMADTLNDDTARIELAGYLREGILSGIRQKYGESVENELYSLINDELNRSLINFMNGSKTNINI